MSEAPAEQVETDDPVAEREIGHDEYDPIGTVVLLAIYFVIIAGLWFFMYFVEFLGNEPTVTGLALSLLGL